MKSKLINENPRTFAVIFETGDEVTEELKEFAKEQKLSASQFTAIGAFNEVLLGFVAARDPECDPPVVIGFHGCG